MKPLFELRHYGNELQVKHLYEICSICKSDDKDHFFLIEVDNPEWQTVPKAEMGKPIEGYIDGE